VRGARLPAMGLQGGCLAHLIEVWEKHHGAFRVAWQAQPSHE
jgi:hypothetical protein